MTDSRAPADAARPFVSVVLPVLNGAGRLEHALEALNRQDYPRSRFEVIVADGRSRDATAAIAAAYGCRVVDNPGITVAAGRNVGIEQARGELIAFSEDDIVLPPSWLSSAVRLLNESGAAGVGGPTPIPPSSNLWSHAVNAVFRLASARGASVQSDRATTGSVDDLPGGNSLYWVHALRAVGPIDERLTTAEDVAMHRRLRERGWELRLYQELAAEHHKRDSVVGFFRQMQRFAIGRVQLWRRWSGALSPLHWAMAAVAPLALAGALALCAKAPAAGLVLIGLSALAGALTAMLIALRQGERLAVAVLFPFAFAVFSAGWSSGFWSEWLIYSRDPKRIRFAQKVQDALANTPIEDTRSLRWLLGVIVVFECTQLAAFSQHAPFIMDEFQQGGYARHIDAGYYSTVVPFKTVLFTYPYYLPRLFFDRARPILLAQRAETVVIVLATLLVQYFISRRLGRTKTEAGLVVATTLAFSTFFEHAASLRAEPAALLLAMLALLAVVATVHERPSRGVLFSAGLALGGSFLCTQKAVWFSVSIGLATLIAGWHELRSHANPVRGKLVCFVRAVLRSLWLALGFLTIGVAYCFAFPPATPAQVFRGVFRRSSQFALAPDSAYGDLSQFIVDSFERNAIFYGVAALGACFAMARWRDAKVVSCWITALGMGTLVLTWKEPWPYTFTWWLPFFALFVPDAFRVAADALSPRLGRWKSIALGMAVLAFLAIALPRRLEALGWDNRAQLDLVDRVESLLAPGEHYLDGIGMISTRPLSGIVWWDVPAVQRILAATERGNDEELTAAFRDAPKVIIMNYRLQNLRTALAPFLDRSYIPIEDGLLIAGAAASSDGTGPFEARWAGRYALVNAAGERDARHWLVDGKELRGAQTISRGSHRVEAPGCTGCFIVPDDVVGKVRPARVVVLPVIFDRPYTR
jgi:GT2 family glycosyltransferase